MREVDEMEKSLTNKSAIIAFIFLYSCTIGLLHILFPQLELISKSKQLLIKSESLT